MSVWSENVDGTVGEEIFGDPLFPTAAYDPGLNLEPLRECYVMMESCTEELIGDTWHIWHIFHTDIDCCGKALDVGFDILGIFRHF